MNVGTIQPIGSRERGLVDRETQRFVAEAENLLSRRFRPIAVHFDLTGRAAGMFRVEGRRCWIRYNPWIFAKHFDEHLADTVPHEVAHYIVHEAFGRRGIKPHGEEWRLLMTAFGARPKATFSLDLEGIPHRRQRTHPYRCTCRDHEVSSTRHNRIVKGTGRYHCRYCDAELVYAG